MKIQRVGYHEYIGDPREWVLEPLCFGSINLIVGKNATGKSRTLNVIHGLSRLIAASHKLQFEAGAYSVQFDDDGSIYQYDVEMGARKVIKETLTRDGKALFERNQDGIGTIYSAKTQAMDEFSIPNDVLVLGAKRDRIQHPFVEIFHEWSSRVRYYAFSSSLGRDQLAQMPELMALENADAAVDHSRLYDVYSRGYRQWGVPFDEMILRDLGRLGYDCEDVGMDQWAPPGLTGLQLAAIYVKERSLPGRTFQSLMSQGMFRALGMVIHLTYATFAKESRTVLVDDIGEGLDFERANAFVKLLTERCQELELQLFMTSNDRFVMNSVALDDWCILRRDGTRVSGVNQRNAPDVFKKFKYSGLSNFDFFSSRYFESQTLERGE